jgi:hypothetical protein
VEVIISLVVLSIKSLLVLRQCITTQGNQQSFGKLDIAILVYDLGQLVSWWYSTASGFSAPLHANWVSPIQWLTPTSYAFFILAEILPDIKTWVKEKRNTRNSSETEKRNSPRIDTENSPENDTRYSPDVDTGNSSGIKWSRIRVLALALLACSVLAAVNSIAGGVYTFRRFSPGEGLGAGSYIPLDPFPALPARTTSTCRDLLHNPASPLYSDPNWTAGKLTQAFVASATAFVTWAWIPVLLFFWCYDYNVKRGTALAAYGLGIVIQFVALIWLIIVAKRGVPLMLHEGCGVVVIAMSPARGYYDSKLHYKGFQWQVARTVFGMCKSRFVQLKYLFQANYTSQRRLHIRSRCSVSVQVG